MKRLFLILLVSLIAFLPGCGLEHEAGNGTIPAETVYPSDTSSEDCYLCGGGIENLIPSYWGQNNVALISLNTFEIKPIEINRYDRLSGRMIEEYAGVISFGGGGSTDGGFSANLMLDYDRGYATGSNCLNEILPQEISRCFGVGAIHLDTKEICLFEENLGGFGLGDFYFDCNLKEHKHGDSRQMDLLIFYCPIRYKNES